MVSRYEPAKKICHCYGWRIVAVGELDSCQTPTKKD